MSEVKAEIPTGDSLERELRRAETVLVKLLQDKRCWADQMDIVRAIEQLRWHESSMRREQELLSGHKSGLAKNGEES